MNALDFELAHGIGLEEGDEVAGYATGGLAYVKGDIDYIGSDFVALEGGVNVRIHNIIEVNGEEVE